MIVREENGGFVLVNQHDHGLLSGEFARRFSGSWLDSPLHEDVLYAISNHDVGWESLDSKVSWNAESGRPYSFVDYPPEPKMAAYADGLDAVEDRSTYAGLLCSAHYGSFVARSEDPAEVRFREKEELRRRRIRASLDVPETFERDFRLLQLCDDLSLFVCLNEPGGERHPWHRDGFEFFGKSFDPVWSGDGSLRFEPNPLSGGFDFSLPRRFVGEEGSVVEADALKVCVIG